MVTHRLSRLSYIMSLFLLANSTCWPLIHFFYRPTQRVGLISPFYFFTGQLNVLAFSLFFYWPTQRVGLFFTGQLNVLAFHDSARWISSAFVIRPPTCSGNISWSVGHWQPQETWHHPTPQACKHFQAKPNQPCTVRAKLETTCHIFYLWFPMVTLPPKLGLQLGILSAWPFCCMHEQL